MDRPTWSLSGGEAQRTALALQLENHLSGAMYVLDEPTAGLHASNVDVLARVLEELASRGNTVIVVEHDLALVPRAAHIVEMGPAGGRRGGSVLSQGRPEGLAVAGTPTGRQPARRVGTHRTRRPRPAGRSLVLHGCHLHKLKASDVAFPIGTFTCVTGVSGAGKSSLVAGTLVPVVDSRGLRVRYRDLRATR